MNTTELSYILPLVIIAGAVLLILLTIAIKRSHLLTFVLSMIVLILAASSMLIIPAGTLPVGILFTMDGFGRLFILLILLASLAITIIAYDYLAKQQGNMEEYYVLLLTGTLGSSVLVIASHFISFFLGLELLSISLYILAGYLKTEKGLEAAIKYLVLAGVSSSFLLMGIAMLYSQTGSMEFAGVAKKLSEIGISYPLVLMGFAMIMTGIGFKLAIVPLHLWTPDVYEGAPAPTTAYIASVSKGGMLALLIRFFMAWEGFYFHSIIIALSVLAILSMLVGNLLALRQRNVKRMLAYSSIAHLGYMMVAFIAGGDQGVEAVSFYLLAYFITIIAAFGIMSVVSQHDEEAYDLSEYRGLFWQKPWLAVVFTVMLFSLAGIPLTAGFIG
ncbi:MAG: NADH-quinone oxidoreductase subunit N, partial [Candidatus Cyclobacteriaceae bacterium M3_2C_046]